MPIENRCLNYAYTYNLTFTNKSNKQNLNNFDIRFM